MRASTATSSAEANFKRKRKFVAVFVLKAHHQIVFSINWDGGFTCLLSDASVAGSRDLSVCKSNKLRCKFNL